MILSALPWLTPKDEAARAQDEDRDAKQIAFLKRFTVFNVDQCEGLPAAQWRD